MVNRIPLQLLIIALLLTTQIVLATTTTPLVSYSFDDEKVESGPDTFQIFEHSKGVVQLSYDYSFSGHSSVKIQDQKNNIDFPELQGYFPLQDDGFINVHFALLLTDVTEKFNIALAGPNWFTLKKDGINFWLTNKNSNFYHLSDSISKKLAPIMPFTWYEFDINYNVVEGTYDLVMVQEGLDRPIVKLQSVKNATNQINSRVNKFSFIGDLNDKSNTIYYIDDVRITTSQAAEKPAYIAPGRRKMFIDYWYTAQQEIREKPVCLPSTSLSDFDLYDKQIDSLKNRGQLQNLSQIILAPATEINEALIQESISEPKLWAIAKWRLGCKLLASDSPESALQHLVDASRKLPNSKLIRLSKILALAANYKFDQLESELFSDYSEWRNDDRYATALAMIGLAQNDLYRSEEALTGIISNSFNNKLDKRLWSEQPNSSTLTQIQNSDSVNWRQNLHDRLIIEQYYFILLFQKKYEKAELFAEQITALMELNKLPAGKWYEYQGNAAFLNRDYRAADQHYKSGLASKMLSEQGSLSIILKLSDLAHMQGDLNNERYYRELIYGTLYN